MRVEITGRRLLLSGITSLLLLFATDLLIRWRYPMPAKGYGAWAAFPGSKLNLVVEPDDLQAMHRYNRFGFRGPDAPAIPSASIRVACVGDSYTEGVGVQEAETWPSVLSQQLSDIGAEVIALGKPGGNAECYARILCRVALPLKPTDVIVCMIPTDLRNGPDVSFGTEPLAELPDPFRRERPALLAPFIFALPGWVYIADRARGKWPVQRGMYWPAYTERLTERAAQVLAADKRISMRKAREIVSRRMSDVPEQVLSASRRRRFNPYLIADELAVRDLQYEVTTEDMRIPVGDLADCTHAWLDWYASTCRRLAVRPWLLFFPQPSLVSDGPWGPLRDGAYSDHPRVHKDTSVRDLLRDSCGKVSIPFIDATSILREHRDERLFFRYDTHPTARAYELVTTIVAEQMRPVLDSE